MELCYEDNDMYDFSVDSVSCDQLMPLLLHLHYTYISVFMVKNDYIFSHILKKVSIHFSFLVQEKTSRRNKNDYFNA